MSDQPSETRPLPQAGDVWREWTGVLVRVVRVGVVDDHGREMIVYEPAGPAFGPPQAIPAGRWLRQVTLAGGVVMPRFELVAAFADRPDPPDTNPVGPEMHQRSHH